MGLGLEERWCPQNGGVGGIGVGSDVGGIGAEGTLVSPKWGTSVALGSKGRWCVPRMGVLVALGLEVALVALGLEGHQWRWG